MILLLPLRLNVPVTRMIRDVPGAPVSLITLPPDRLMLSTHTTVGFPVALPPSYAARTSHLERVQLPPPRRLSIRTRGSISASLPGPAACPGGRRWRSATEGAHHPAAARPPASTRSSGRPGYGVGHRQRTLAPDTMLMSSPEMTWPFTRPGERAIFRVGASKVPSTIALQHPVPPPPPEKATCPPVPMML